MAAQRESAEQRESKSDDAGSHAGLSLLVRHDTELDNSHTHHEDVCLVIYTDLIHL